MSYLENALNHQPVQYFQSARANDALDFFSSRAKFLVSIVEKVMSVVQTFFQLVIVDTLPAIINLDPGRANLKADLNTILGDFKDIPVGLTGLIFGCSLATRLHNKIHGVHAAANNGAAAVVDHQDPNLVGAH